jgi:transposase
VTTPQDRTSRKIVALCRIRGLGENFAAVLTREVFYRSFDNRRQIASYVGITPMRYQSGNMDRDRRISPTREGENGPGLVRCASLIWSFPSLSRFQLRSRV